MSPNIGEISQMNSVCTDYTSLLASEDFKRVLSIVLQKSWVYNSESIQAIFEKLWNSENLTEDEQNTLGTVDIYFKKSQYESDFYKWFISFFQFIKSCSYSPIVFQPSK